MTILQTIMYLTIRACSPKRVFKFRSFACPSTIFCPFLVGGSMPWIILMTPSIESSKQWSCFSLLDSKWSPAHCASCTIHTNGTWLSAQSSSSPNFNPPPISAWHPGNHTSSMSWVVSLPPRQLVSNKVSSLGLWRHLLITSVYSLLMWTRCGPIEHILLGDALPTVSYTHLTLPTICSV